MTKKDFKLIAATIANGTADWKARKLTAYDFADALADVNRKFDRSRFLAACGVTE